MKVKTFFMTTLFILSMNGYGQNNSSMQGSIDKALESLNKLKALEDQKQPQISKPKTVYQWKTAPDGFRWLPFEDDGYLGVKNAQEQIIVPAFYNNIKYSNGFFIVKDRMSIYAVYSNTGDVLIPASDVVTVNVNEKDKESPFVLVTNKGKWLAVSQEGKVLVPEDYYSFIYTKGEGKGRYLWVGKDGYQGIFDSKGNVIIPLGKYNRVDRYETIYGEVTYSFGIYGENNGSGVCDEKGNELIRTKYYETTWAKDNNGKPYYRVLCGDQVGEINANGSPINMPSNPRNREIPIQMGKLAQNQYRLILTPEGKIGVKNAFSRMIIPTEFDNIVPGKKHFLVVKGNYMGAYDINGKCIIEPTKYASLGEMDYYFSTTSIGGISTAIDFNGREMAPFKYSDVIPLVNKSDTILAIKSKENHLTAIFNKQNKQITPFIYDDCNFLKDNINNKTVGYLIFKNGRVGVCKIDGTEYVEPIYTDIEMLGIYTKILKVKNGNKCGALKLDGTMIFPAEIFDNIIFLEDDNTIVATNSDRKCTFGLDGKLLSDTRPNPERDNYIQLADAEFEKSNYLKAADLYGKAITIEPSASLYYNRGISYYNAKKWNKAVDDLNNCLLLNPSQNLIDNSRTYIYQAREYQAQKVERRQNIAANIFGLVLGVANVYVQHKVMQQSNSNQNYVRQQAGGGFVRDRSMDYLLDPNYAMQQVQIQNWNEYLAMTNGGKTMSYDEWYALKAQAWAETQGSGSGNDLLSSTSSSSSSSSSSTSSRSSYSPDCRLCYGLGSCRTCEGRGYYYNSFDLSKTVLCPNCPNHNGKCSSCGGTGKK